MNVGTPVKQLQEVLALVSKATQREISVDLLDSSILLARCRFRIMTDLLSDTLCAYADLPLLSFFMRKGVCKHLGGGGKEIAIIKQE